MKNINGNWLFKKLENFDFLNACSVDDIERDGLVEVSVPHTWYKDGAGYKGTALYEREFTNAADKHKRVFLEFMAADRYAKVFVNDSFVGEHKGGYQAFTFDITEYLIPDRNTITVLLDNRDFGIISPLAGDFTVFGGIYRDVNLYEKNLICFDRTYYGTSGIIVKTSYDEVGKIVVTPHVINPDNDELFVNYRLVDEDDNVALETIKSVQSTTLILEKPNMWNGLNNPKLYTLISSLVKHGEVIDVVETTIGIKKVDVFADKGFFLNDEHLFLQGVAKHQDQGDLYNQIGNKELLANIADIKEIGANSVRLSHYQHPQRMYDICDEEGLVVWAEIPMLKLTENDELFENAKRQMEELILQNIHHVSIAFWGIQNEIAMFGESEYMYDKMIELNNLVHELDDTRISGGANLNSVKNNSKLNRITDVVGHNVYYGWYYGEMTDTKTFIESFHKDNPDVSLGITEYGVDCNTLFHSDNPKVKDYTEDYQALYHETVYPFFKNCEFLFGSYIWNLYDFNSEIRDEGKIKYRNTKGIITGDRTIKKDAFYYYKSQWQKRPFVKLAQKRFVNRVVNDVTIKAYSNQPCIKLQVNDEEFEVRSNTGVFLFKTQIKLGENRIKASIFGDSDEMIVNGVQHADENYIYVDDRPGLNVKNWFTDLVEEERLFPKDCYSIKDDADTLKGSETAMKVIEMYSPFLAASLKERGGNMPLDRILFHMKGLLTDEQCRKMNEELIKVKK